MNRNEERSLIGAAPAPVNSRHGHLAPSFQYYDAAASRGPGGFRVRVGPCPATSTVTVTVPPSGQCPAALTVTVTALGQPEAARPTRVRRRPPPSGFLVP